MKMNELRKHNIHAGLRGVVLVIKGRGEVGTGRGELSVASLSHEYNATQNRNDTSSTCYTSKHSNA